MNKYNKTQWVDAVVTETGAVVSSGTLVTKQRMNNLENGVEAAFLNSVPTAETAGTAAALTADDPRVTADLWDGYALKVILHTAPTATATLSIAGKPAFAIDVTAKAGDVLLVIKSAASTFKAIKLGGGTASETPFDNVGTALLATNVQEAIKEINTTVTDVRTNATLALSTITVQGLASGSVVTATCGTTTMTATCAQGKAEVKFSNIFRGTWNVTSGGQTKECVITGVGDYTVAAYEQLVNYTMLYDNGNENVPVTGGWVAYNCPSSNGTMTKNTNNITINSNISSGGTNWINGAQTSNTLNLGDYSCALAAASANGDPIAVKNSNYRMIGFRATVNYRVSNNDDCWRAVSTDSAGNFILANGLTTTKAVYMRALSDLDNVPHATRASIGTFNGSLTLYNFYLFKIDDYKTLCTKANLPAPATLAELIADTSKLTTIFANSNAVEFMVKRCTGDFMAGVISNAAALTILNASQFKTIIQANTHWAKFLAMAA